VNVNDEIAVHEESVLIMPSFFICAIVNGISALKAVVIKIYIHHTHLN